MAVSLLVTVALFAFDRIAAAPASFCDAGPGWEMLWTEEFDGNKLDLDSWTIDTGHGAHSSIYLA